MAKSAAKSDLILWSNCGVIRSFLRCALFFSLFILQLQRLLETHYRVTDTSVTTQHPACTMVAKHKQNRNNAKMSIRAVSTAQL